MIIILLNVVSQDYNVGAKSECIVLTYDHLWTIMIQCSHKGIEEANVNLYNDIWWLLKGIIS